LDALSLLVTQVPPGFGTVADLVHWLREQEEEYPIEYLFLSIPISDTTTIRKQSEEIIKTKTSRQGHLIFMI
jgi:hypothetical protein